eukprot:4295090-Pyramimonas_sp.AAC.1
MLCCEVQGERSFLRAFNASSTPWALTLTCVFLSSPDVILEALETTPIAAGREQLGRRRARDPQR